jgi:hypothetical protein
MRPEDYQVVPGSFQILFSSPSSLSVVLLVWLTIAPWIFFVNGKVA